MVRNKRIFSEEEVSEICRLYVENKLSLKKIGKKFKADKDIIKRVLKNKNIEITSARIKININHGDKFGRLRLD